MTSSADRLLQFVVEHEGCGQELDVGHLDHDQEPTDLVLRCPGCCASLAIPMTEAEAEVFVEGGEGRFSDADILRALDGLQKH
jgi:hypothetical protein